MVFTPQSSAASSGQTFRVHRVNARNGNDFRIQSRFVFGRPKSPNTLYSNNKNQPDRSASCLGVSLVWWNESESSPSQASTGRNEALKVIAVVSRVRTAAEIFRRFWDVLHKHTPSAATLSTEIYSCSFNCKWGGKENNEINCDSTHSSEWNYLHTKRNSKCLCCTGSIKIFWSWLQKLNMYEQLKYAEFILNI